MSLGMCCEERTGNVVSSLTLYHKLYSGQVYIWHQCHATIVPGENGTARYNFGCEKCTGVTGNSVPPTFRSGGPSSLGNWVPPGPKSLDVVIYTFVLVHKKYTDRALLEDIDMQETGWYILRWCGLYGQVCTYI